jgi:hypothetical protein
MLIRKSRNVGVRDVAAIATGVNATLDAIDKLVQRGLIKKGRSKMLKHNPATIEAVRESVNQYGLPVVYFSMPDVDGIFIQASKEPDGWHANAVTSDGMFIDYSLSEDTERDINAYIDAVEEIALRPNPNTRRLNAYKRTPQTSLFVHGYERESYSGNEHDVDSYWRGRRGKGAHPKVAPTPRSNPQGLTYLSGTESRVSSDGTRFQYSTHDELRSAWLVPFEGGFRLESSTLSDDELRDAVAQLEALPREWMRHNPAHAKHRRYAAPPVAALYNPLEHSGIGRSTTRRGAKLVQSLGRTAGRIRELKHRIGSGTYSGATLQRLYNQLAQAEQESGRIRAQLAQEAARVNAKPNPAEPSTRTARKLERLARMFHGSAAEKYIGRLERHPVSRRVNKEHYTRLGALPYIKMLNRPPGAETGHDALDHACEVCAICFNDGEHAKLGLSANGKLGLLGKEVLRVGKALRRNIEQDDPTLKGKVIDLQQIEVTGYLTEEKHADTGDLILYYHPAAEDSGRVEEMPHAMIDEDGMIFIPVQGHGSGNYSVDERGIIN